MVANPLQLDRFLALCLSFPSNCKSTLKMCLEIRLQLAWAGDFMSGGVPFSGGGWLSSSVLMIYWGADWKAAGSRDTVWNSCHHLKLNQSNREPSATKPRMLHVMWQSMAHLSMDSRLCCQRHIPSRRNTPGQLCGMKSRVLDESGGARSVCTGSSPSTVIGSNFLFNCCL